MKTFKLVSLHLVGENGKDHHIELLDGLIINQEDEENHWIIEALLHKDYLDMFNDLMRAEERVKIQATISKKSNDPATFAAVVIHITPIDQRISILMKGLLLERERHTLVPETILAALIEQGLHGPQLLQQFKRQLNEKKSTTSS